MAAGVQRTQYYAAVSVDGYIADAGDSLEWLFQAGSSAGKKGRFSAFFSQVGAMAMGAKTYLWALEHEQGLVPVILGSGAPLLPRHLPASAMTLTDVGHDGQFAFLTYQVTQQADG
jgi:hypothetical protein